MRDNEYTRAIEVLKKMPGQTDEVQDAIKVLDGLIHRGTCSICGEFGCMSDHGYGGPGPDAY